MKKLKAKTVRTGSIILAAAMFLFFISADISYSAEKAKKYPNWYEMHIKQGIINEQGSGGAQLIAADEAMRMFQARRPDGLNPEVCAGCHGKGGAGAWLYGNPNYRAVKWTPAKKYKKTAADTVEAMKQAVPDIKASEDR
jgi:mono/diheme cytochrome c family protein